MVSRTFPVGHPFKYNRSHVYHIHPALSAVCWEMGSKIRALPQWPLLELIMMKYHIKMKSKVKISRELGKLNFFDSCFDRRTEIGLSVWAYTRYAVQPQDSPRMPKLTAGIKEAAGIHWTGEIEFLIWEGVFNMKLCSNSLNGIFSMSCHY